MHLIVRLKIIKVTVKSFSELQILSSFCVTFCFVLRPIQYPVLFGATPNLQCALLYLHINPLSLPNMQQIPGAMTPVRINSACHPFLAKNFEDGSPLINTIIFFH